MAAIHNVKPHFQIWRALWAAVHLRFRGEHLTALKAKFHVTFCCLDNTEVNNI